MGYMFDYSKGFVQFLKLNIDDLESWTFNVLLYSIYFQDVVVDDPHAVQAAAEAALNTVAGVALYGGQEQVTYDNGLSYSTVVESVTSTMPTEIMADQTSEPQIITEQVVSEGIHVPGLY